MPLLDLQIHAWIARYLSGTASLEQFEDWFIPATWEVERSGNLPAAEVATPIRTALAELSADPADELEFRALLASLQSQRTERMQMFEAFVSEQDQPSSKLVRKDFVVTAFA